MGGKMHLWPDFLEPYVARSRRIMANVIFYPSQHLLFFLFITISQRGGVPACLRRPQVKRERNQQVELGDDGGLGDHPN